MAAVVAARLAAMKLPTPLQQLVEIEFFEEVSRQRAAVQARIKDIARWRYCSNRQRVTDEAARKRSRAELGARSHDLLLY